MKKPKIETLVGTMFAGLGFWAEVHIDGVCVVAKGDLDSKPNAREWAKEWCRTVGSALTEKGGNAEKERKALTKLLKAQIVRLKQPRCTCDQQSTDPNCPALKAGYRVGADIECSVPPREKGK